MFCFCIFQLYNFGETVSIVFWTDTWRPDSFYDKIKRNKDRGMHTLCLLGSFYMTFNSFTQKIDLLFCIWGWQYLSSLSVEDTLVNIPLQTYIVNNRKNPN